MQAIEENYFNQNNPIENFKDIVKNFKSHWVKYTDQVNLNFVNQK